jgi:hypothetical protein
VTDEALWHPDLLRRFAAAPYIFSKDDGPRRICIQSNDLEIALAVRRSSYIHELGILPGGLCKLIRDTDGPVDGSDISVISDLSLRVLCLGRGTILIHDRERSELFGFISCNVTAEKLASSLIPLLLNCSRGNGEMIQPLLQRSDKQHIAS